jgi:hypothetical protein
MVRHHGDVSFPAEVMGTFYRESGMVGLSASWGYTTRQFALVQQGISEVVEGAPTAVAPGAFALRTVLVRAPASNVVALAPRTLEQTIFPLACMDGRLALFAVEELVDVREQRHG